MVVAVVLATDDEDGAAEVEGVDGAAEEAGVEDEAGAAGLELLERAAQTAWAAVRVSGRRMLVLLILI